MFYERKIKYLDYMVNGVRNGNAGFWKLEARDTVCNMTLQVKGLRNADSLQCVIYLVGNGSEKEMGSLELIQGCGNMCLMGENLSNLGGTGIPYEMLEGIRISISPEREVRGVLREGNDTLWEKSRARDDAISETAVAGEVELESKTEHQQKIGAELTTESQQESVQEGVQENVQESTQDEIQELAVENDFVKKIMDKPGSVLADGGARRIRMCDSKWDQLWKIYPHIVPFRDEREYISITPGDFVVLPAKYFRLTNNSFLLHGYYNYKHLVLSRMEVRGEEKYYIGVPGTFFEREKQVAVMFGFESFECMEEPACAGDYGYYMMKIEL